MGHTWYPYSSPVDSYGLVLSGRAGKIWVQQVKKKISQIKNTSIKKYCHFLRLTYSKHHNRNKQYLETIINYTVYDIISTFNNGLPYFFRVTSTILSMDVFLVIYRFFYQFLLANERTVAKEIRDEYVDTMSKIYFSYFKSYSSRLLKVQVTGMKVHYSSQS